MRNRGQGARVVVGGLLFTGLTGLTGCLSCCHPVDLPKAQCLEPCQAVPKTCRNHVYVFFMHGADPLNFSNLSGVREYVQRLGFPKTYYGQLYHVVAFEKEIRRVHHEDPEARFVLVGFSYGANAVCHLAHAAQQEGILIDLLVYLGGNTLKDVPQDKPENALRIVNILANGWIWNGAQFDRGENINLPDVWHFGSPTHPETLKTLARELALVAGEIPRPEPSEAASSPWDREAPTPHAVSLKTPTRRDEWDFLKPVSELAPPPQDQKPAEKKPGEEKPAPRADRVAAR